ncbi:DUF4232 domain-containing protein [Cryobacterium aureum]|uniref:DUF4232 domain-containing protein n=1 Tax=Cryobacterium aureum TaxID=995037 RepID=UPI000CF4570C|nr:DUF4232 domain-containing protein [Cryobacterium aureum]
MNLPFHTTAIVLTLPLLFSMLSGCSAITEPTTVVPSISSSEPTTTATESPAACADLFGISVLESDYDPAVPQVSWLAFTNEGDSPCELTGFPEITLNSDDTAGVATLSEADAFDRATDSVAVPAGGNAYIWTWVTTADLLQDSCALPTAVQGLNVTLPGATKSLTVDRTFTICLGSPSGDIQVGPVDSEPRTASKGY